MVLFSLFLLFCLELSFATPIIRQSPTHQLVGGRRARSCEFPHMVYLKLNFGSVVSFCGGSILDREHILTSAHCMNGNLTKITVSIGSIWRYRAKQKIEGAEWFLHPDFKITSDNFANDIALVKLKKKIKFNKCVHAISLPEKGQQLPKNCSISGWGFLGDALPDSMTLNRAPIQMIPTKICQLQFPGIHPNQQLCIGDQTYMGPSTCHGDSGGPLTCTSLKDEKTVVAGVASFGYSCNHGFSIFANVENYIDWLKATMQH